jgi:CRISPR-associated protein Csb2
MLHGHGETQHLAWLPLADVGHNHASGMLHGIGLAIPRGANEIERRALLQGLAQLDLIRLPDARTITLSVPAPGSRIPKALRDTTWTQPSHDWATVTPVVFDRAPKRPDPEKLGRALVQSLQLAGYPEPELVELSSASWFKGSPISLSFAASQPRFHARIRFSEMISGPVLAGRQRFFGVGFFRPISERETR